MNAPKVIEQPIPIGSFHQKSSSLQKDIAQQGQPVQHNNYRISQINQQVSHNRNLTPPQNHNISIPKNNTKNVPLPNLNRSVSRNKVHVSPVNTNQNNNAIVPAPAPQPPLNLNFSSGMFNQAQITTPSNINKYNFSIPPAHQKIPVNPNINNVNL
jgi:hypothetical protein